MHKIKKSVKKCKKGLNIDKLKVETSHIGVNIETKISINELLL